MTYDVEAFQAQFAEWLEARPEFKARGNNFIEVLKTIAEGWYIRGTRDGFAMGVCVPDDKDKAA